MHLIRVFLARRAYARRLSQLRALPFGSVAYAVASADAVDRFERAIAGEAS
jgi:hypothetical protein